MPVSNLDQHWDVTPAEAEALRCLGRGLESPEAADELDISFDALRARIFRFENRTDMKIGQVRVWASKHGHCCLKPGQKTSAS